MYRLFGISKIILILTLDFIVIYRLFHECYIAFSVIGIITLYILLGGYLLLLKEGAVSSKKLPEYQRNRLEMAKSQLITEVRSASHVDISRIKLYLIPEDDSMNATAYGCHCISVTRATLDNTDPMTLNAVLAHEVSHSLNFDAECNRAFFCSVTLIIGMFSVMSFSMMAMIFLLFFVLGCFHSCLGIMFYQGTTKVVAGICNLLQQGIVMIYRSLLSLASRHAEYRSDKYSCMLGYGVQLSYFLSITEAANKRQMTLTEAMYRSHPPTSKRIARLERQLLIQDTTKIVNQ